MLKMSNPPVKFKKDKEIIVEYETQVKGKDKTAGVVEGLVHAVFNH